MTAERLERDERNASKVSQDLILWRLDGLESEVKVLRVAVTEVVSSLKAYKAVMRFAVAVGGATGAFVAFIAEFFLRK